MNGYRSRFTAIVDPTRESYMLTITFKMMKHIRPRTQLLFSVSDIQRQLRKCSKFILIPELTLNSVIHYHALITIYDWIKWHKTVAPYLKICCGNILLKKVDDVEKVINYITKDVKQNERIFGIPDILFDGSSIINIEMTPMTDLERIIEMENNNVNSAQ